MPLALVVICEFLTVVGVLLIFIVPLLILLAFVWSTFATFPKLIEDLSKVFTPLSRFLEHPRVYIFQNSGERRVYISSADFMTRNLENRVEVSCPIYDINLQNEIADVFEISWNDNTKSRIINLANQNKLKKRKGKTNRSQWKTYEYYQKH